MFDDSDLYSEYGIPVDVEDLMTDYAIRPNIKKLRKARNLSQKELARILGVAQSTLSSWESGTNAMDVYSLIKLAYVLRVSFEELMSLSYRTFIDDIEPLGHDREFYPKETKSEEELIIEEDPSVLVDHVSSFDKETLQPQHNGETRLVEPPEGKLYTYSCPENSCFGSRDSYVATALVREDVELCEYEDGDYVVAGVQGKDVTICRIYIQDINQESFILTYPGQERPPVFFSVDNNNGVTILGKILKVELILA